MFKDQMQLPSHVVFFDSLDQKLVPFLRTHGYEQVWSYINENQRKTKVFININISMTFFNIFDVAFFRQLEYFTLILLWTTMVYKDIF
jgi:hypothetical protein